MPKYHVERSTEIEAPAHRVFETVVDYGTWTTWSPWLVAEPDAEVNVTSDSSSVGSVYSWKGDVTGQGEIEHRSLDPGKLIDDEIRFLKPFKSVSRVSFNLEETGSGTKITWNMDGSLPWFLFWMRPMMEAMIGMDYERGLRMLKEWIETGTIESKTTIKGIQPVDALRVVGVKRTTHMKDIGDAMDSAFAAADEKFSSAGLPKDGNMVSVYQNFNMKTQVMDFIAGYAVPASATFSDSGLSDWSIPVGSAFHVEHIGRYEHLGNAWSAAHQHTRYKKMKVKKAADLRFTVMTLTRRLRQICTQTCILH